VKRNLLLATCLMWQSLAVGASQAIVAPVQSDMSPATLDQLVKIYHQKLTTHPELLSNSHNKPKDNSPVYLNALIKQNSPYLLRHATNPINWKPWSNEVFSQAKAQNKLVFLSIGYSTCHWCHVMEQDSFVKQDIAKLLNQHFIAVKVDRESHPAIDELYTEALTQVTGSSGWPITGVLNEKGEPVFINAFLPHDKLKRLLTRLHDRWQKNSTYLNLNAANLMSLVRQRHSNDPQAKWDPKTLAKTVQKVIRQLDNVEGGFTGKPKFPTEAMLIFLLDELTRNDNPVLSDLVELHLDKMSAKGLYDSIHGGFHRYSTDSQWLVPHYEKMLYNQGQLLMVYAQAAKIYGKPRYKAIVKDTVDFIRQWFYQPNGGLYSAIDAEFRGQDGAFYLRTAQQLAQVSDTQRKAAGMTTYPFEHGDKFGVYFKQPNTQASQSIRKQLAEQLKQKPHIDKKTITAWNALVIWGLADAWQVLQTPDIKQLSVNLAQSLWSTLYNKSTQQLYRNSFNHTISELGTLEDYAFFAKAMTRLFDITTDKIWLDRAGLLSKAALSKFKDKDQGFMFTDQHGGNTLAVNLTKTRDAEVLAAGAVMVEVLQDLWLRTGDVFYRQQLKGTANHLKGRLSADPLNHLYAAKALNNIEHKNTVSKQYFAGGRGTIELFDAQAVCRGEKLALKVNLQPQWHVNSSTPLQRYLRPTKVTFNTQEPAYNVDYPKGERVQLGFQKDPLEVYQQQFELNLSHQGKTSKATRFQVDLQACSDKVCLLPEKLSFYLPGC
jgi:uncharacterized protein YyaL (SSP411 family)